MSFSQLRHWSDKTGNWSQKYRSYQVGIYVVQGLLSAPRRHRQTVSIWGYEDRRGLGINSVAGVQPILGSFLEGLPFGYGPCIAETRDVTPPSSFAVKI